MAAATWRRGYTKGSTLEEVSEEVHVPAYPEPKGISPYLPPTRRTRTKSPGTLRKVTRVADLEVHPAGPPHATHSADVEHMSQEQLQVQAKILANASFDGLNRSRVAAVLEQVRGLGLGPFDLQLAPLACCDVHCDIPKLLAAVLQKGTVPWLRCCCSIQTGRCRGAASVGCYATISFMLRAPVD